MIELHDPAGPRVNWYAVVAFLAIGICAGYPMGYYVARSTAAKVAADTVAAMPAVECPAVEIDFKTLPTCSNQQRAPVTVRPAVSATPVGVSPKAPPQPPRFQSFYEMLEKYETQKGD
jgi:hypothetical protein